VPSQPFFLLCIPGTEAPVSPRPLILLAAILGRTPEFKHGDMEERSPLILTFISRFLPGVPQLGPARTDSPHTPRFWYVLLAASKGSFYGA